MNINAKKDGWVNCGLKLEVEFSEANLDWEYNEDGLIKVVIEILKTPYLNRLKQFMLRLLRNNLLWGGKTQKIKDSDTNMCYICGQHIEKRISILFFCEKVKEMTQYLIRVLKKFGFLGNGHQISLFLFQNYKCNTFENLTLATLWN